MISSQTIHWIAGIMEGEGTFCLTTPNHVGQRGSIRAALSMTDRDVVERFANILGLGSISIINFKRYDASRALMYRWECSGSSAAGLMMTLYPLLGMRRQQRIRELLDHWKASKWASPKKRRSRKVFSFTDKENSHSVLL